MNKDLLIVGSLLGGTAGFNLFDAYVSVGKYLDQVDSIREAIYSKAPEITPELIKEASALVDSVSTMDINFSLIQTTLAGFCGAAAYGLIRASTNHDID